MGEYIEVIAICLADFGQQDREVFAPELFGEFYTPAWKLVSDVVHRYPDVKVWIHCCGSVPGIIPHFIDAGVDCLNPVQWTAAGMDLKDLKAQYGNDLVFWGGAVSTQKTLPFGTAEEVVIKLQDKELVLRNPSVVEMRVEGESIYQIIGGELQEREPEPEAEEAYEPSQEDIALVAAQADVSEDEARSALIEAGGDLAKAILLLKSKNM